MPSKDRIRDFFARLEVIAAIIMFFVMLVSCGMYIDIKMNGKSSSLPPLPKKERAMLSMTNVESKVVYQDDLLEPVFIGVKNDDEMVAASFDSESRRTFERLVLDSVVSLFLGQSESVKFENINQYYEYIDSLKNRQKYMLISFYSDIPSSVFMPCFSGNYGIYSSIPPFYVKHMFLVADESDSLYSVCLSTDYQVTKLFPKENISFSKLFSNSYDVNDGFSRFEFLDTKEIRPVISSTQYVPAYSVEALAKSAGKDIGVEWIDSMLDLFGVNMSLVKSFSSGDKSETNFVDELCELLVKDDGTVTFRSINDTGINLSEYLGYFPESVNGYTFNDKVFAVKNIVNKIHRENDNISYSIVDVKFEDETDTLEIFLKTVIDGIFLTEKECDAQFKIRGNSLIGASFSVVAVKKQDSLTSLIPQRYATYLFDAEFDCYAVLSSNGDNSTVYVPKWFGTADAEVAK